MKRCRGFSLIETLVVMTVASAVLGTLGTLLFTLLRAEQAARNEIQRRAELGRLAQQFRSDAHAALRCGEVTSGGENKPSASWQFELPGGGTIQYQNGPDGVTRTEREGQAVRRHESFSLPAESTARIEVAQGEPVTLVTLVITYADQVGSQSSRGPMCIEAVLRRDHRFAKQEER